MSFKQLGDTFLAIALRARSALASAPDVPGLDARAEFLEQRAQRKTPPMPDFGGVNPFGGI